MRDREGIEFVGCAKYSDCVVRGRQHEDESVGGVEVVEGYFIGGVA